MRKVSLTLCSLALAATLSGCAGEPTFQPLAINSPLMQLNGFSVMPPQSPGWQVSRAGGGVQFYKQFSDTSQPSNAADYEPQTFVISIDTQPANSADIATMDDLLRYVGRYVTTVAPERRQRLIEHHTSPFESQGTDCVRYTGKVEEQPRKLLLDISGTGITCRHPNTPGQVVRAAYSERHTQGSASQPVEAQINEAEAVLKSVTFSPLK